MDLDEIPFPVHQLYHYCETTSLLTSRGCYGNCAFCSEKRFDSFNECKVYRMRSVKNVIEEIEMIQKKCKPRYLCIVDSNFMPGTKERRQWLNRFVNNMKDKNIYIETRVNKRANDIVSYEDS